MTAMSTIAIDDEVRDQRQRVPLLRGRERGEVGLRSPRVLLRPRKRVLDARVVHDAPPDLVDLVRVEGGALEETRDPRRLDRRHPLEHGDERQRPLPLPEVGADRLAKAILIRDEIERVVRDLEGDTDVEAVPREGVEVVGGEPAEQPADATACGDERGGLLRDDPDVVRLRRDTAALELELEDFRLGHRDRRARQGLHHGAIVVPHEHRERLRVQVVTDEDGGVVAPLRVRRRPSAAQRRLVDDIGVNERRRVKQLDDAREAHAPRAAVAGQARAQQQKYRAKAFAPGARDVAAHLLDQGDGRAQLSTDLRLDKLQVGADQTCDALLQDPFEGGRGHAGSYLGTTRSLIWIRAPAATVWTSATENFSRISITRAVATSSSSSPSTSPVTGCTMGIASRRRLTTVPGRIPSAAVRSMTMRVVSTRSEEHTSELQSLTNLVCRLLLEKKKKKT